MDDPHEVDREEVFPGRGQLVEHETGVVHQAVDPAERVDHRLTHRLHLARVAHVGLEDEAPTTHGLDVLLHVLGLVDALEVDDGDVGAFRGQRARVRGADALGAAGDDADLVEQSVAHGSPLVHWPAAAKMSDSSAFGQPASVSARRSPAR